jgi:hypothetical protein
MVEAVQDLQHITSKRDNSIAKRIVVLYPNVHLSLWYDDASNCSLRCGDCVAITGVQLNEFRGCKTLSTKHCSYRLMNRRQQHTIAEHLQGIIPWHSVLQVPATHAIATKATTTTTTPAVTATTATTIPDSSTSAPMTTYQALRSFVHASVDNQAFARSLAETINATTKSADLRSFVQFVHSFCTPDMMQLVMYMLSPMTRQAIKHHAIDALQQYLGDSCENYDMIRNDTYYLAHLHQFRASSSLPLLSSPSAVLIDDCVMLTSDSEAAREPERFVLRSGELVACNKYAISVFDTMPTFTSRELDAWERCQITLLPIPPAPPSPMRSIVANRSEFQRNLHDFTGGVLRLIDWSNVFAAGGAVAACMQRSEQRQQYNAGWAKSDVDLFLVGLDARQIERKVSVVMKW